MSLADLQRQDRRHQIAGRADFRIENSLVQEQEQKKTEVSERIKLANYRRESSKCIFEQTCQPKELSEYLMGLML